MNAVAKFHPVLTGSSLEHVSEDALERFLLNHCQYEELEVVETHILACDSCLTRLDILGLEIEAARLALQSLPTKHTSRLAQLASRCASCFSLPRLSLAGAGLAASVLILMLGSIENNVTVTANRGDETSLVSPWLPLRLHLDSRDLSYGLVDVEIVDSVGRKIWEGDSSVNDNGLEVKVGWLTAPGPFFIRVFSQGHPAELLREYSIQIRPVNGRD